MSIERARKEIDRFLSTSTPEVLSISGRWGVGKTHTWDTTIESARGTVPLKRYAYVSTFGLRSVDALKTAIVQSTVRLDRPDLAPTVGSFLENLNDTEGMSNLAELGVRRGFSLIQRFLSAVPYAGRAADLLAPGAALLIRNQIICIDDIERSGHGLDVGDILGLVSSLRERRGCKIVLLLNESELGEGKDAYRQYLEKTVDQAITFEPTAEEAAAAALQADDEFSEAVRFCAVALGITNVRVIRHIRRFLSFIEQDLSETSAPVRARVIQSIVLLGWSVFESKLGPKLERIKSYSRFYNALTTSDRSDEDKRTDNLLSAYNFAKFEDVEDVLLDGLLAGGFDDVRLRDALSTLNKQYAQSELLAEIERPWAIYRDSFANNDAAFVDELIRSVETCARGMSPGQISDAFGILRKLGREDEVERLLKVYMEALKGRDREFFQIRAPTLLRGVDPAVRAAFDHQLAVMPLEREPKDVLLRIAETRGWSPEDAAFLASISVEDWYSMLKNTHGTDLHSAITTALDFGSMTDSAGHHRSISDNVTAALNRISAESPLNALRVQQYIN